jgi:hypothetical protein
MIQGSVARIATIVITSTLLITTAASPGGPDHALHAVPAAAAVNASGYPSFRPRAASRAVSRSPPASQASRRHPRGTSTASLQTASAHSRRSAGITAIDRRSSPAIARVAPSMTRPALGVVEETGWCGPGKARPPLGEKPWQ